METKLKKKLLPNLTLPANNHKAINTRIAGVTPGNIAGLSVQPVAYERSREYLSHIAEVEIRRSLALADAYRLSLR
jgi:hypothetical protein